MEACEAREYGSESKRKHQVEGVIMQAKAWTRTFGRCTQSRSNKASMSALEKNLAKRRREVMMRTSPPTIHPRLHKIMLLLALLLVPVLVNLIIK
jgi:hypothetical protein